MDPPPPRPSPRAKESAAGSSAAGSSSSATVLRVDGKIEFEGEVWDFEKKLGSGRFASVYRLRCSTTPAKTPIAAKVTTLQGISPWARSQLSEEMAIWQTLRHPNIVQLYGHLADATKHILLLELARGGELFERIVSMTSFCEELAARQIREVLSALEYLHSFGVLHRDLKPENLLLESEADDAPVKVADFGASKLVISCGAKTPCGSLGYAAPEQLRGLKFATNAELVPPYDKEVDLWSVGVITYILLSGSMPFDPTTYSAESLERHNGLEFPPSLFGSISAEACEFIRSLLQIDPSKRLSAETALLHPWLSDPASDAADGSIAMTLTTPSARTTPLPTPTRMKGLLDSGKLKKAWDRATEAGGVGSARVGSEVEAAREQARKRALKEIDDRSDPVPTVFLPAEVTKRLRSEESTRSMSSGDNSPRLATKSSMEPATQAARTDPGPTKGKAEDEAEANGAS